MSVTDKNQLSNSSPQDSNGMNEAFVAQMLQISGGANQYIPTTAQVDRILDLQEKGMDYTHQERTSFLPSQIFEFAAFVIVIVAVVGIFIFCSFYAREYLGEVVSAVAGFIGGGLGGYGYAKIKKSS